MMAKLTLPGMGEVTLKQALDTGLTGLLVVGTYLLWERLNAVTDALIALSVCVR